MPRQRGSLVCQSSRSLCVVLVVGWWKVESGGGRVVVTVRREGKGFLLTVDVGHGVVDIYVCSTSHPCGPTILIPLTCITLTHPSVDGGCCVRHPALHVHVISGYPVTKDRFCGGIGRVPGRVISGQDPPSVVDLCSWSSTSASA